MDAKILVVEDNTINLDLMVYLLEAFGYAPVTAGGGERGLAVSREQKPDLVLLDVHMSGINGLEVVRQLKEDPLLNRIPVVAVTALAMVGDRDKLLSAGFDGYIAKPIDPEQFVGQVEAFLPASLVSVRSPLVQQALATLPPPQASRGAIAVFNAAAEVRELIRNILEPVGYAVTSGGAQLDPPTRVCVAVIPPDSRDLREVVAEVRSHAHLVQTPVLLVFTAQPTLHELAAARGLSHVQIVVAPLDASELITLIESLLVPAEVN